MSDDDLTEAVRAELDPTPAHAVDWPVSRRRVLGALASVGALAAGPGGAQGAAGTGIADEAFFSNYGWEPTADGGELTIDGATFTFDGSETIGLPDGGTGTKLVTPSGASASEVIGPDGSVVFEGIPDSVVDGFEDNDISEYSGDTGAFGTTQSDVIQGSTALELTNAGDEDLISSTSGLQSYPQKGDVFSAILRDNDNALPYLLFGWDSDSGYGVRLRSSPDTAEIYRIDAGSETQLTSASGTIAAKTYYEVEVEWHDGSGTESDNTIVANVYDIDETSDPPFDRNGEVLSMSATDSNYANQTGVGWKTRRADSNVTIADYYIIRQQVSDL